MRTDRGIGRLYFWWFVYKETHLGTDWFKAAAQGFIEFDWLGRYLI
jgi:hypothetical protein